MLRLVLYMMAALIVAFCGFDGWFAWDRGYSPIYLVPMFGLALYALIQLAGVMQRPKDNPHA
jgi:hypothetical protein